jgi:hypothetical protein
MAAEAREEAPQREAAEVEEVRVLDLRQPHRDRLAEDLEAQLDGQLRHPQRRVSEGAHDRHPA